MNTHASETKRRLVHAAGFAGVIGGAAVALAYGLHPPESTPEIVASTMWAWIHGLFLVSLVCGVFLLQGLLARYLDAGGRPVGALWYALAVISLLLILGLDYAEIFIFPVLAVEFPEVVARYGDGVAMPSLAFVFPASGALFLVGWSLFALQLKRVRAVDPRAAVALLVSVVAFSAGLSGFLPFAAVKIGAALFGAGLAWAGWSLMGQARSMS
jgi:hypothetical protein